MSALGDLQLAVERYLNSDPPDGRVAELCAQLEDEIGYRPAGEVQSNG